jgi:hypothetical protein
MRRYPVLVAFVKQALFDLTDVAIDLFDACLWQRHVDAKKELDAICQTSPHHHRSLNVR